MPTLQCITIYINGEKKEIIDLSFITFFNFFIVSNFAVKIQNAKKNRGPDHILPALPI